MESVKFVYCPSCGQVSMLARLEREVCQNCRKDARVVRVRYPWQTLVGIAIILAGTAFLILGQTQDVAWRDLTATLPLRIGWFVVFVGAGLFFSMWGARVMRAVAARKGQEQFGETPT